MIIDRLAGIIDEYDISPQDGLYGWQTRHLVIARKIAEYKFSGIDELVKLFQDIARNINPANAIELQSVRDLCDIEFGIGRLGDANLRQKLYRSLIAVAPGERIPRHRLIRELLEAGELDEVDAEIRNAEATVRADAPIDRYKVRLLIARSKQTPRISDSDRVALLRKAYEAALQNVERHKWDKVSYFTLCDVALELIEKGESEFLMQEALDKLRNAADSLHDPEIQERLRQYERRVRR
jgi:hypothetical protein